MAGNDDEIGIEIAAQFDASYALAQQLVRSWVPGISVQAGPPDVVERERPARWVS